LSESPIRPPEFNRNVLASDEALIRQTLLEGGNSAMDEGPSGSH
jgi:hypothetical protein